MAGVQAGSAESSEDRDILANSHFLRSASGFGAKFLPNIVFFLRSSSKKKKSVQFNYSSDYSND
jgi:hypothetical protein